MECRRASTGFVLLVLLAMSSGGGAGPAAAQDRWEPLPLWGGDVAKKVNYLEQGGSVWVFKLMK